MSATKPTQVGFSGVVDEDDLDDIGDEPTEVVTEPICDRLVMVLEMSCKQVVIAAR